MSGQDVSDPNGITGKLCSWAADLQLSQVPEKVQTRAKHIVLDGVGCALIGAHLPWSETAAKAVFDMEPAGSCSVFGWDKKLSGSAAVLLNSTFIQGFELDDYHSSAPLHSCALLLPALFAAVEQLRSSTPWAVPISGEAFLLATIIGLETGPRIGLALGGAKILSHGWHSGAVFGGPSVALAVSKLLSLSRRQMEWAVGTACTQAGGLMSAQFGSMAKRMQHGFAARNGFLAAFLARANYSGIECVLERTYGGFLKAFTQGSKMEPPYDTDVVDANLGVIWEMKNICIKPYAAMAGLHASLDCINMLQNSHPEKLSKLHKIRDIKVEMGEEAFKHGGWAIERQPLEVVGAQMNARYVIAVQLIDKELSPSSYGREKINRSELYDLINRTQCVHQKLFDASYTTRITVSIDDELEELIETVQTPRGVNPPLSNEEIQEKWKVSVKDLLADERAEHIASSIIGIERIQKLDLLLGELRRTVKCVLD